MLCPGAAGRMDRGCYAVSMERTPTTDLLHHLIGQRAHLIDKMRNAHHGVDHREASSSHRVWFRSLWFPNTLELSGPALVQLSANPTMSAFGGKADVLGHPLECLLIAITGHSAPCEVQRWLRNPERLW